MFFLASAGLHFSIEFTGGTVMEVSYDKPAEVDRIRATLEKAGVAEPQVQNFGSSRDVLIRLPLKSGQSSADLSKQHHGAAEGRRPVGGAAAGGVRRAAGRRGARLRTARSRSS